MAYLSKISDILLAACNIPFHAVRRSDQIWKWRRVCTSTMEFARWLHNMETLLLGAIDE